MILQWSEEQLLENLGYVYHCVIFCLFHHLFSSYILKEFAKVVEADNVKRDMMPLFHNLASDDQVGLCVPVCPSLLTACHVMRLGFCEALSH